MFRIIKRYIYIGVTGEISRENVSIKLVVAVKVMIVGMVVRMVVGMVVVITLMVLVVVVMVLVGPGVTPSPVAVTVTQDLRGWCWLCWLWCSLSPAACTSPIQSFLSQHYKKPNINKF